MRYKFLIILCLALTGAASMPTSRTASLAHAQATPLAHTSFAAGKDSRIAPPQTRKRASTSAAQAVREIDTEGLKKLLQRGSAANRPLLVTFWATWCDPCREEFPDLVKIDTDFRRRGLEFITVSLDDVTDIKTTVPQYLQRMHAQMPAYLLNIAEPDAVIVAVDKTWSGGLPATFLYDARGQIAYRHVGRINPDELRAEIEKQVSSKQ